ncbi:MAG: alpha-L-fucosidase [Candidatus Hydrogenedentes bacterium]|nr:alpha-L-fucosidase [Candidatus Hydrogenedentota bacterium]
MRVALRVLLTAIAAFVCAAFAQEIPSGPFQPNWDSLKQYKTPEWYADAKFGIFIHWGVYSVPAYGNEWYPRDMYKQDTETFRHHVETYGKQSEFGYKDFIPLFTAEKFNADEWASLFKQAGARYVVPVAEHHDGFAMYKSELTHWNAVELGPKRDVIGELAAAVRKQDMVFGVSSHRAEHWWFFNEGMKFDSDVRDSRLSEFYGPAQSDKLQPDKAFLDNWYARCRELVDAYHPQVMWFDWWIEQPAFAPYLQRFAAYYYNRGAEWNQGVVINYKNKSFPPEAAVLDIERGKLGTTSERVWQTDTSIGIRSWGYVRSEIFRSVDSLVDDLVDIASKNGCLLLNIGPMPDGTIPDEAKERLLGIGEWLRMNGEAIYGTRPWAVYGEGPTKVKSGSFTDTKSGRFTAEDIRFTRKGDALYAIVLARPESKCLIHSLGKEAAPDLKIKGVRLLANDKRISAKRTKEGLVLRIPKELPGDYAFVFKILL